MTSNRVTEEAAFLVERLREFENVLTDDHVAREFMGHVEPSASRLEALLAAAPPSEDEVERVSEKIESNLIEQYKANPTWEDAKDVIENIDCVALAKAAALSPRRQAGMIGEYLRDLDYSEGIELQASIKRELRRIIESAFDHPEARTVLRTDP
jgi:hypothetical protein